MDTISDNQGVITMEIAQARQSFEQIINEIDELERQPYVETLSNDLRSVQTAARKALKEVETCERNMKRYYDSALAKQSKPKLSSQPMPPEPMYADLRGNG